MTNFRRIIRSFLSTYLKEKYFVHFNIIFLISLIFNINNRTLIIFSFIYILVSSIILRSITKGLIFSFLLFQLFLIGKTFEFLLIPRSYLAYGGNIPDFEGYYEYIIIGPIFFIRIIIFLWGIYLSFQQKIRFDKFTQVFLLYFLLSLISAIFSINSTLSLFYWFFDLPILFLFYFIKKEASNKQTFIYNLLKFFSLLVIFESIIAIAQYLTRSVFLPNIIFIKEFINEGIDLNPNWFRPWGTLTHPNELAYFLLPFTILFFLLGFIKNNKDKRFYLLGFAFGLIGIILSLSRSAWLTLLLIIIPSLIIIQIKYYNFIDNKFYIFLRKIFLITIPLIFIFIIPRLQKSILTFDSGGSGLFRLNQYNETLSLIAKYPLFGVGQGMSIMGMFMENPLGDMYYFPTFPHNIYIHLALEVGLVPFAFFFFFIYYFLLSNRNNWNRSKPNYKINKFIYMTPIIAIFLNGVFQPWQSSVMIYLVIFSIIYNVYLLQK